MEAAKASSGFGSGLGLARSSLRPSGRSPICLSFRQPPWPASRLVRGGAPLTRCVVAAANPQQQQVGVEGGQAICAAMEPERGSPREVREEIARCYELVSRLGRGAVYLGSSRVPATHPHYHQTAELAREMVLTEYSSDEEYDLEEEEDIALVLMLHKSKKRKHGGSVFGRQVIHRERQEADAKLMRSYFNENPTYPPRLFRRRFRMSVDLFKEIARRVKIHDSFFEQKRNAAGQLGHSTYQKVTSAIRQLAYGIPADLVDDHLAMSESQSIKCVKRFAVAVVEVFGPEYLRAPNAEDTARILATNKARGFPGMLGSIDCMHWRWKNCPAAWHGQFRGHKKDSTIILEAVADHETWIWHAFFGMPGSCNDINVLQRSPLFAKLANGEIPHVEFEANNRIYNLPYYLADGIYPKWSTFVKPVVAPEGKKEVDFHSAQAAARKDVERAFGILQAQFAIVRGPARFWDEEVLWYIMTACIIMHNMIIQDERGQNAVYGTYELMGHQVRPRKGGNRVERFLEAYHDIRDEDMHKDLQKDLMEEWWKWYGRQKARSCT